MEAGDIIIQVGGFKVKDVYEYMEALSKFEKGQSADVKSEKKGPRSCQKGRF
ncbi:MAG: hypothetical protein IPL31_17010 [Saprospiraceae bacterium]|nr:hypothetical protein [Saprospiraceae bacterium]